MAAFDKQKLIENFQVKRSGAVPNPVLCYRSRSNLIESVHRGGFLVIGLFQLRYYYYYFSRRSGLCSTVTR